jgi:histone H3/H4
MRTGFDNSEETANRQAEEYMKAMVNIVMPVLEQSVVLAAQYAKACGRDVVLSEDVEYASKFCAMHKVGQVTGSIFPDVYDEEESDGEEIQTVPESDLPPFTRYSGNNPLYIQVNQAYDSWDAWTPRNPAENILKNAINKNDGMGA